MTSLKNHTRTTLLTLGLVLGVLALSLAGWRVGASEHGQRLSERLNQQAASQKAERLNAGPRRSLALTSAAAPAVTPPSAMQTFTIGGVNYTTCSAAETVTAPFTSTTGSATVNQYSGLVLLSVSGTGWSLGSVPNDAFYYSVPGNPTHDTNHYQLVTTIEGSVVVNSDDDAYRHIVYDVDAGTAVTAPYTPAYRADNTYNFILDMSTLVPAPSGPAILRFGVNDGAYGDNGGQYVVQVTQLCAPPTTPEPNALNFDDANGGDKVSATLTQPLFGPNSTTIEFWAQNSSIFAIPININGVQHGVIMGRTGGRVLAFNEWFGSNFQTGYLMDECWHHFAFTYNGSTGTMYAFVDGQPTPTPSHPGPWNVTNGAPSLTLGQRPDGTAYPWNGTLDELRIWNVQRTQAQLQANMFSELAGNEAGLLAYYKFNQGVAGGNNAGVTTLTDSSPKGSNGTLSSFALTGSTSNWVTSGGLMRSPEAEVRGNGFEIQDGDISPSGADDTNFGSVAVTSGSVSHTFTILNTGAAALTVSGISLSGANAADFTVGGISFPATVAPSSSTTFTLTFDPSAGGLRTATVEIANNDCNEAPYDFAVQGTGLTNQPPVARCQNVTVSAGATCTANASINNGSSDPDAGDSITLTQSPAGPYPLGATTVTLTVTDSHGASSSCQAVVTVVDATAPTITSCPANLSVAGNIPGSCAANVSVGAATATDNCGIPTVTGTRSDGQALNAPYPQGVTTITWTARDAANNAASCTQTVTVTNPAPVATITGPATGSVYSIGTPVNFTGSFSDNAGGTHTATWKFDALTQAGTVNEATGAITGSYTFTAAGVYKVSLTVADGCGGSHTTDVVGPDGLTELVVIYDASAGWVTGGGWINSPAGAYVANPNLTGKANFGFVSKYQNGASVPTGNTEFQFKAGNLNFSSTVYEWMVISGARAQYKGSGTINGAGDYRFMLTAIDGQEPGGGGTDKFRIRIWNNAGGGLVYDNQMNAPDSADPTTVLGGGSIVIHK